MSRDEADETAAHELVLYIENDGDLYRRQHEPILKNLATKKARGVYDHDKAVKLYMYLTESGARSYVKEFGGGEWNRVFTKPTRLVAAEELTKSFETEYKVGGYRSLLPKKYQTPTKPAKKTAKAPAKSPDQKKLEDFLYGR